MFLSRWTAHEQWNITFILLKTGREEGHQFVNLLPDRHAQFVDYMSCVVPKLANLLMHSMLSRLETCIVYSCTWSVTLAKSIVPRKTWRKLWHSYISKLFLTKMQERLRELSSTKTGSYPHVFLCRTNCSACADYQPWICPCLLKSIHVKQSD
jgi:hypothetical protein